MWQLIVIFLALLNFNTPVKEPIVRLVVLGTIQDAGSPHIGCRRECCADLYTKPDPKRLVVSLGLIDESSGKSYLIEATPDMTRQLQILQSISGSDSPIPDGIFVSHAHIGHYTGLMYLGREALGASNAMVYAMPKMRGYLESNGPWDQLVKLNNIKLNELGEDQEQVLTPNLRIVPVRVPHRDEYSETVGFKIIGPSKTVLFIPDIDKWGKWDKDIVEEVMQVDYALVDGSFFSAEELGYRDMAEIPHPSVRESMDVLHQLSRVDKAKVYFIHLNHTNPLLNRGSDAFLETTANGFNVASFLDQFLL